MRDLHSKFVRSPRMGPCAGEIVVNGGGRRNVESRGRQEKCCVVALCCVSMLHFRLQEHPMFMRVVALLHFQWPLAGGERTSTRPAAIRTYPGLSGKCDFFWAPPAITLPARQYR